MARVTEVGSSKGVGQVGVSDPHTAFVFQSLRILFCILVCLLIDQ